MSENTNFKPGQFCWWELSTTDADSAKKFYSIVRGWTPNNQPMSKGMDYTMLEKNGKQAAALYQMDPNMQQQGIPPHWSSYIGVENADETARRAKELNATILAEPFD